jgi:hypothetical protein
MKSSYYLTVDATSNKKGSDESLDQIIDSLDKNSKSSDILEPILNTISLNFQNYVYIGIEEEEFPVNYSDQIEEICDLLDEFLPGGCTIDSRIEWGSDADDYNLLWFKTKDGWEFSEIENDMKNYGEKDWDDEDDEDERASYW